MSTMPKDEIVGAGEAARIAKVSVETVRRWSDEGKLPSIRTLGGHRRFRRADVEKLNRFPDEASA